MLFLKITPQVNFFPGEKLAGNRELRNIAIESVLSSFVDHLTPPQHQSESLVGKKYKIHRLNQIQELTERPINHSPKADVKPDILCLAHF